MTPARRWALIAAGIAIAVVAFIIASNSSNSGNDTSSSSSTTTGATAGKARTFPTVRVQGGKPAGGIQQLTFNKGDTVKFKVVSDVADEVHVHGYDFHKDVAPGHPITFSFPGKIDGEFVVELESRKEQIASLRVNP